jgi:hypothetical protein
MNKEALTFPPDNLSYCRKVISRRISALQLVQAREGQGKLGPLSQLAPGTDVEICGDGYNEKTTKVRVQGVYFFVFREDLETDS